jgi:hypothetical protein
MPPAITTARVGKTIRAGDQCEQAFLFLQVNHVLIEVPLRAELSGLVGQLPGEVLGQYAGVPSDIEDVFLGVQGGELAAKLRQRVHNLGADPPHSGIEQREQPGGPRADDRDVNLRAIHSHQL